MCSNTSRSLVGQAVLVGQQRRDGGRAAAEVVLLDQGAGLLDLLQAAHRHGVAAAGDVGHLRHALLRLREAGAEQGGGPEEERAGHGMPPLIPSSRSR
jgi:hypothetical protein